MYKRLTIMLACASALTFGGDSDAKKETKTADRTPVQTRYSREQLDKIRARLASQIAVYDAAEKSMRAPTPQEARRSEPSPAPSHPAPSKP